jgi:alkylation response protein AidB-like acyl-CoA dehydrogenase
VQLLFCWLRRDDGGGIPCQLILDSLGRFLDREVKPHVHALEHDDVYPATISADYGGLGLATSTFARIVEKVSTVWMSLAGT